MDALDSNANARPAAPSVTLTLTADLGMDVQVRNCTTDVALMLLERALRHLEHGWRYEMTKQQMQASLDQAHAVSIAANLRRM